MDRKSEGLVSIIPLKAIGATALGDVHTLDDLVILRKLGKVENDTIKNIGLRLTLVVSEIVQRPNEWSHALNAEIKRHPATSRCVN